MLQSKKIKYRLLLSGIIFCFLLPFSQSLQAQNALDSIQKIDAKLSIKKLVFEDVSSDSFAQPNLPNFMAIASIARVKLEMGRVLLNMEQNGFPFARFTLDSLLADSDGISLKIKFDKGPYLTYDSIDVGGNARISKAFLHYYLGININEPYNEKQVKLIDSKLSELPYIKVARPTGVYFSGNRAKLYLYLENKKASSFDGIIGFAPNSQINNKLVLTGDLNLRLLNLAGSGKNLSLSFKSFLSGSQDLQAQFFWPFFLKTKIGIDYTFKLLRFDTTYIELFNDITLQYALTGTNFVKLFFQQQQVNVLSPDTLFVRQTKQLPQFTDVKTSYYGLGFRFAKLDYALNPRRGYLLDLDIAAGAKRILENNLIKEISLQSASGENYTVYDSLNRSTLQYKFNGQGAWYLPISKNWVWVNQMKVGWVYNSQLFLNELYRIGGIKTLKGFDEQSIFASTFAMLNIEMKYLFQQNSGFLLFANGAYYTNAAVAGSPSDWPWGVGAGMNLETGAGLFSLYYAVGSQKGNPLAWRNAKIHFGLLNFF